MRTVRHRTGLVIGGILVIIGIITTGSAGASTHWFGLASPHYSQQIVTGCNSDWRQANADLAEANAANARLDLAAARQWIARSRAATAEMKAQGCPAGPYPLRNP